MDETGFSETQTSLSDSLSDDIRQEFDIDGSLTQYLDLLKPLYSGIAARLKIAKYYGSGHIPQSVAGQARYWASSYTVNSWTNAINVYTRASAAVDTSKHYIPLLFVTSRVHHYHHHHHLHHHHQHQQPWASQNFNLKAAYARAHGRMSKV